MMNRSGRILVVDDEAPVAFVLRRSLAARGYEALVASEGEEALEIINSWATNLVVTEVSTLNMGGLELFRKRGRRPCLRQAELAS